MTMAGGPLLPDLQMSGGLLTARGKKNPAAQRGLRKRTRGLMCPRVAIRMQAWPTVADKIYVGQRRAITLG